ncbi:Acetyl-CoA synthetase [hydrothermal vent metagenome]|uniref:acetate--CoA ligase n=1 Tax=hydrothermal vent metagenome TaxID=652676 RepID=A0A3B1CHF6_9ZZZZ
MSSETIESVMTEDRTFEPSDEFRKNAHVKSFAEYKRIHKRSVEDPEGFWGEKAEELHWFRKWDKVKEGGFDKVDFKWFTGGKINVSYNCLDRHLNTHIKNKAAIIWQGEPEEDVRILTYQQMHREVCRFANVLKKHGIGRGDRIMLYMPMIPELAIAMLACTRIGVIHSKVYGGFSAQAIFERANDCGAKAIVTADGGYRGGKVIPLKNIVDEALKQMPTIKTCFVFRRTGAGDIAMVEGRDLWWHEEMAAEDIDSYCPCEEMDAEDPLFILYTSGSTGKPKGVLHTTGGYLVYAKQTFKWIFDYRDEDTYWCTADIGWITGHTYIVYGPLCNGATSLMFEGVPTYPDASRFWKIVEKFKVNIFYTAPTAIRALMAKGDQWLGRYDISSLRLLGTVGEPINPEAWMWYHKNIGKEKCPIVDTFWQTENGGIIFTPLPGAITTKPGSTTFPFPGVDPVILRKDGSEAKIGEGGYLCIKQPWPGMMRTVYGSHEKFVETYFSQYKGYFFTSDGARQDKDGYFWIMGRVDDVLNISGHRIGTAEVESALVSHDYVAEAAVVGYPHAIKGQGIYAYVTLVSGHDGKDEGDLKKELIKHITKEIGPIARPDKIQFSPALPKTRSGKIMRRILRKIAQGATEDLGDTSTLADPTVVTSLIKERIE